MAYGKKESKTEYLALNEDLKALRFRPCYLLYG